MFRQKHFHMALAWILLASSATTIIAQEEAKIRPLAPGVLTVIPTETEAEETLSLIHI